MGARNLCSTQMIIVWIWGFLGFISEVDTVYLELTCPQFFKEDSSNTVTCKINQTALSSVCSPPLNNLQFSYIKPDTTLESECKTPNLQTSNTCSGTISQGLNSTCLCAQKNGDIFIYELHFIGSKAQHEGIKLQCVICYPQNAVDQSISASCNNIKFDPGETTSDNLTTGEIIGIVIGTIFGATLTAIFIILVIYHFACGHKLCGKQGYTPCCKPAAHPMRHPN